MRDLLNRASYILRHEGAGRVIALAFSWLGYSLFACGKAYVLEHTTIERNAAEFLPKIKDFEEHVVHNRKEAEDLRARGRDMLSYSYMVRERLDDGGFAVCIFAGGKLAHIGWAGAVPGSKAACDSMPYFVDFANRQGCTGGTVTIPEFEGNGFMKYGYYRRLELLRQMGMRTLPRPASM